MLDRSTIPIVEAEAKRRDLRPSAVMAGIVDAWARARADAAHSRRMTACRGPGCERAVTARGLCGAHYQQARAGKPLTFVREQAEEQVVMGSVRLPLASARWLKARAVQSGHTLTEELRRTLAAALDDPGALANASPTQRGGGTFRLGVWRLPAALAEQLNVLAQQLGLSAAEVIRRAVDVDSR